MSKLRDSPSCTFITSLPVIVTLIEAKFYVEPPCDRGMKVNTNGLCHMTKIWPPCPYMGFFFKSSSLEPKGRRP